MSELHIENPDHNQLTEHKPYKGSPVAGYMRSAKLSDPRFDKWESDIRAYAAERGYNLVAVLREEGVSEVAAYRPMIAKLIGSLELGVYVGVLVTSVNHFTIAKVARQRIITRITGSGAWIQEVCTS